MSLRGHAVIQDGSGDVDITDEWVYSLREFESRGTPGKKTGVLAIIEGVRFWVREDAINKERNLIDPAVSPSSSFTIDLS